MSGDNSKNNPDQEAPAASSSRVEETAGLLTAGLDSITPAIAQRLAATAAQLAELIDMINNVARESAREAEKDTRKLGLIALLRELQDPQVQESLKFILALSRHLPDLLETL